MNPSQESEIISSEEMIAEGGPAVIVDNSASTKEAVTNSGDTEASTKWKDHEHVSPQVQLEAEKLVQLVGSPELAKHAISAVEQQMAADTPPTPNRKPALNIGQFQEALANLETALATPVVSGELIEWATNALNACEVVKQNLTGEMQRIHAEQFTSILRDSVDLAPQVEKMRTTDEQLSKLDCNNVFAGLTSLLAAARSVQQDEAKLVSLRADVVKRGMDFVVAARSQETSITTWMSEAVNRDLGSGD